MAFLHPFRALRPEPTVASRVASVPYDVVSRDEAATLANGNPLSFLHVTRAEIGMPASADPHAPDVYRVAAQNLRSLRRRAPLILEPEPSLYVYRLAAGDHAQTGLAGCYSLDEYEQGRIKRHEHTRRDKENDRTRHMVALRAQTGLTFLTYRARPDVSAIVERVTAYAPLVDFATSGGVTHRLWRVPDEAVPSLVAAFASVPTLYIADGHHRIASADRARTALRAAAHGAAAELADDPNVAEYDTFVAVAFPHDQVRIQAYNRVVSDLGGRTPAELREAIGATLQVEPGPPAPSRRGEVCMFLDGAWHRITLGEDAEPGDPAALDVTRLQQQIIEPLLGIGDVRTDPRIAFVGGARGTGELERLVREGEAAVAFSLFPVSVDDLLAVSDAGGIMPPKSTWFEPKVCDGLLIHLI